MTTSTAQPIELGHRAPAFVDLKGVDGENYRLSSFEGAPVLAVVFISNGCPTVSVYNERLIGLQSALGGSGLQVVAINSNNPHLSPTDSYAEMLKRVEETRYNFPYLKDEDGSVARAFGALTTPHAFLFDRDRKLRYRGRIDDSRDPSKITSRDLASAVTAVLDGARVEVADTQPFGCAIVR